MHTLKHANEQREKARIGNSSHHLFKHGRLLTGPILRSFLRAYSVLYATTAAGNGVLTSISFIFIISNESMAMNLLLCVATVALVRRASLESSQIRNSV